MPSKNTLGATVYLSRNLGKTLPLMGVIILAVMLIAGIVSLINSIPLSIKTIYSYSKNYVAVTPRGNAFLTPLFKKTIESSAPVAIDRLMVVRGTDIEVKSIVGNWPFVILGLEQPDIDYYLERMHVTRIEGRKPAVGKPEVIISQQLARNLNFKLGSIIQRPDDTNNFSPQEVKIVGIAESDHWFAVGSIEYQRENHFPPIDALIVFAKEPASQKKLDDWTTETFKGENSRVFTYQELENQADTMFSILYQILNVVIGTLVIVITLMMGMLMNIFLSQRVQEFGLLQALGYTKRSLIMRVFWETTVFVVGGWILGVGVAWALLNVVKVVLMDPRSFALNTFDQGAYLYSVPVPVAIFAVSILTVLEKFKRFDPVGVVERRLV